MTTTRAPIAVILADLLVTQSQQKLPEVHAMGATSSNGIVSLDFADLAAYAAWADALGVDEKDRYRHTYTNRSPLHTAFGKRLGWSLQLTFNEPDAPAGDELPAETVAALSEVAATADAAVIVAETLAEPAPVDLKAHDYGFYQDVPSIWTRYGNCATCGAAPGEACMTVHVAPAAVRLTAHFTRPLSEGVSTGEQVA